MEHLSSWLKQLRQSWNFLVIGAAGILLFVGTFVTPPPPDYPTSMDVYSPMAKYIIAGILGIVAVVAWRFSDRRFTRYWWALATCFFVASIMLLFTYGTLKDNAVRPYRTASVYIGTIFTPHGARFHRAHPEFTDTDILLWHNGKADDVWTAQSIAKQRTQIALVYLSCIALVTLTIIFVTQAIFSFTQSQRAQREGDKDAVVGRGDDAKLRVRGEAENADGGGDQPLSSGA